MGLLGAEGSQSGVKHLPFLLHSIQSLGSETHSQLSLPVGCLSPMQPWSRRPAAGATSSRLAAHHSSLCLPPHWQPQRAFLAACSVGRQGASRGRMPPLAAQTPRRVAPPPAQPPERNENEAQVPHAAFHYSEETSRCETAWSWHELRGISASSAARHHVSVAGRCPVGLPAVAGGPAPAPSKLLKLWVSRNPTGG